jgi:hypothetical protein
LEGFRRHLTLEFDVFIVILIDKVPVKHGRQILGQSGLWMWLVLSAAPVKIPQFGGRYQGGAEA